MTTAAVAETQPGPSNKPAPRRRFGLVASLVRRWLGVTDQRHDFNALGLTLTVKDQETTNILTGQRSDLDAIVPVLQETAKRLAHTTDQLNRTTAGAINTHKRLAHYERTIPAIAREKRAYDAAEKRRLEQAKSDAVSAVQSGGGTQQERWPFGPAPIAACPKAERHAWQLIDLFQACEPPAPSFRCPHCEYKWTRGWTKIEFQQVFANDRAAMERYATLLDELPVEPPYAATQAGDVERTLSIVREGEGEQPGPEDGAA